MRQSKTRPASNAKELEGKASALLDEWWFSIIDIVEALTGIETLRKYWNDLKKKLADEGYLEVSEKIGQLKLPCDCLQLRSGC
jgi:hypothetical protein